MLGEAAWKQFWTVQWKASRSRATLAEVAVRAPTVRRFGTSVQKAVHPGAIRPEDDVTSDCS